jgi:hypothetical protein
MHWQQNLQLKHTLVHTFATSVRSWEDNPVSVVAFNAACASRQLEANAALEAAELCWQTLLALAHLGWPWRSCTRAGTHAASSAVDPLPNLRVLDVNDNCLHHLPGNLPTALRDLNISCNHLQELPLWLRHRCCSLEMLSAHSNDILYFHPCLLELPSLRFLSLFDCPALESPALLARALVKGCSMKRLRDMLAGMSKDDHKADIARMLQCDTDEEKAASRA